MFYVNSRAIIERKVGDIKEILIQKRVKPSEPLVYELPGGRIEIYESLVDALVREVKEETGLDIISIEGLETRVDTKGINSDFVVECIKPFAAYQTIKGPVDSVGFYFRCEAEGTILDKGDDTSDIRWVRIEDMKDMMDEDPLQFSDVDRAGLLFYLRTIEV